MSESDWSAVAPTGAPATVSARDSPAGSPAEAPEALALRTLSYSNHLQHSRRQAEWVHRRSSVPTFSFNPAEHG